MNRIVSGLLREEEVGRSRKFLCRQELETFFGLAGRLAIVEGTLSRI